MDISDNDSDSDSNSDTDSDSDNGDSNIDSNRAPLCKQATLSVSESDSDSNSDHDSDSDSMMCIDTSEACTQCRWLSSTHSQEMAHTAWVF